MKKIIFILISFIVSCFMNSAFALNPDWASATTVKSIEATYMPDSIRFSVNSSNGSCPAGTFFIWNGSPSSNPQANVRAIYALLVTAKSTNQTIILYGSNTNCTPLFIYIGQ